MMSIGTKIYFQRHPLWNDDTWYEGIITNIHNHKEIGLIYSVSGTNIRLNCGVTPDRLKVKEEI